MSEQRQNNQQPLTAQQNAYRLGRPVHRINFALDALFLGFFFYFQNLQWLNNSFGAVWFSSTLNIGDGLPRSVSELAVSYLKLNSIPAALFLIFMFALLLPSFGRGQTLAISKLFPRVSDKSTIKLICKPGSPIRERSTLFSRIIVTPQDAEAASRPNTRSRCRLAHEYAHTYYRDYLVLKLYALAIIISPIYLAYTLLDVYGAPELSDYLERSRAFEESAYLMSKLVLPILALYRFRMFLHIREYRADFIAAKIVGNEEYTNFLEFCHRREILGKNSSTISKLLERIFHPTFKSRIERLNSIDFNNREVRNAAIYFGAIAFVFNPNLITGIDALYNRPMLCFNPAPSVQVDPFGCTTMVTFFPFLILTSIFLINIARPASSLKLSQKMTFWLISGIIPISANLIVEIILSLPAFSEVITSHVGMIPVYTTGFYILQFISRNLIMIYPLFFIFYWNWGYERSRISMIASSIVMVVGCTLILRMFLARDMELFLANEMPGMASIYQPYDPPLSYWLVMNGGIFFIIAFAFDLVRTKGLRNDRTPRDPAAP